MQLFAVAPPGLEPIVAAELATLGIPAQAVPGGAEWDGDDHQLRHVLLHARTASRLLVRVASFRARTFFELERYARRVAWQRFLAPGSAAALRVTARKSKLYHEGAIAERLQTAIAAAVPGTDVRRQAAARDEEDESDGSAQLFVVRVLRDEFTISADAAGAPLHRRGYRQALAKAPLRETLAAALLRAARWSGTEPLLDPLCGSGTIPIEAALIARRIPPALANPAHEPRAFAFTRWPEHDPGAWQEAVARARAQVLARAGVSIRGADRNAGAIAAAHSNAARAGVADDIAWQVLPVERNAAEAGIVIVTNPPYGVRVASERSPREVYRAVGELARRERSRIALLSPDAALTAAVGVPLEEVARTRNGGIPVRMLASAAAVKGPD